MVVDFLWDRGGGDGGEDVVDVHFVRVGWHWEGRRRDGQLHELWPNACMGESGCASIRVVCVRKKIKVLVVSFGELQAAEARITLLGSFGCGFEGLQVVTKSFHQKILL